MKKILVVSALVIACSSAFAAMPADAPTSCDGVKVATGPKGKGYSILFSDIKKVCGAKINLCEVNTEGGLDNLNSLSTKDADIGMAQLDTWSLMKTGDENIAALQRVVPLNFNYLHVITSATGFTVTGDKKFGFMKGDSKQFMIDKFTDLRGQRVAAVGSAQLLGRQLNKQLGYGIIFEDVATDAKAFEMVQKGEVAAAFTLSGWPSGTVKNLNQAMKLTMVPFDAPISEPYKVRPLNYKGIAVYNSNTLAIPNVLLSRPFSGDRAAKILAVQQCIIANLGELKDGNYAPGWNEIKNVNESYGIAEFRKK